MPQHLGRHALLAVRHHHVPIGPVLAERQPQRPLPSGHGHPGRAPTKPPTPQVPGDMLAAAVLRRAPCPYPQHRFAAVGRGAQRQRRALPAAEGWPRCGFTSASTGRGEPHHRHRPADEIGRLHLSPRCLRVTDQRRLPPLVRGHALPALAGGLRHALQAGPRTSQRPRYDGLQRRDRTLAARGLGRQGLLQRRAQRPGQPRPLTQCPPGLPPRFRTRCPRPRLPHPSHCPTRPFPGPSRDRGPLPPSISTRSGTAPWHGRGGRWGSPDHSWREGDRLGSDRVPWAAS